MGKHRDPATDDGHKPEKPVPPPIPPDKPANPGTPKGRWGG